MQGTRERVQTGRQANKLVLNNFATSVQFLLLCLLPLLRFRLFLLRIFIVRLLPSILNEFLYFLIHCCDYVSLQVS